MVARCAWRVRGVEGNVRLAVTPAGRVVVALREEEKVMVYSAEGEVVSALTPARPFSGLSGVTVTRSGYIAVLDGGGVQLFEVETLECKKEVIVNGLGVTGGLCEDEEGRLVLLNSYFEVKDKAGHVTAPGGTDFVYVSQEGIKYKILHMRRFLGDQIEGSHFTDLQFEVKFTPSRKLFSSGRSHAHTGLWTGVRLLRLHGEQCSPAGDLHCSRGVAAARRSSLLLQGRAASDGHRQQ